MKVELCAYSGLKIYPGHGKRAVKSDGRSYHLLSAKCEKAHAIKRNPRKVNWTVLYRRKHKKGKSEETTKKRSRRTTKTTRAIAGATLTDILAKRNQKPEIRKMQRDQAIKEAKEKNKAKAATKKATKPQQANKNLPKSNPKMQKGSGAKPRVGGKR